MRKKVLINTDGSCIGNPGPGGYAAIYMRNGNERIIAGRAYHATNNQMELIAVVKAVEDLPEPSDIIVRSDSAYVMVPTERWEKWKKSRKNIPNRALWEKLYTAIRNGKHTITYVHVDGHTGDELNERCDKIARSQAIQAMHEAYEKGMFDA